MGEAKKRGIFEQRKAVAEERNVRQEVERLAKEKELQIEIRSNGERKRVSVGTIGHVGHGSMPRRLLLASLLVITASRYRSNSKSSCGAVQ